MLVLDDYDDLIPKGVKLSFVETDYTVDDLAVIVFPTLGMLSMTTLS